MTSEKSVPWKYGRFIVLEQNSQHEIQALLSMQCKLNNSVVCMFFKIYRPFFTICINFPLRVEFYNRFLPKTIFLLL